MSSASRYRIVRALKTGGMAEVLEAQVVGAAGFERRVALKRLKPELAEDPALARAFVDEARIAAQLHHAGIVAVLDFGLMDGDVAFQALELVEGIDVAALIAGAKALPAAIALHVASELAHALDYAHHAKNAAGQPMRIVHRDVSPHNILLSWTGDVKLADFGIASALARAEKTRAGVVKGKPRYMAPEHARGDPVDHRADVFSLGCVLHEMLAGESPLETEEARTEMLARGRITISRALPEDLARIVAQATRPEREQRFQRASQLADACGRALSTRLSTSPRARIVEYLEERRPKDPEKARSALSVMMDLELVLSPGEPDESVRHFKTVVTEKLPPPPSPVRVTQQPRKFPWRWVLVPLAFVIGVLLSVSFGSCPELISS
jgi:serine/threonine protein kinase